MQPLKAETINLKQTQTAYYIELSVCLEVSVGVCVCVCVCVWVRGHMCYA